MQRPLCRVAENVPFFGRVHGRLERARPNDVQMKVENGQFAWTAREKCANGKERSSAEIRAGHCGERRAKSDTNQNEMFRKKHAAVAGAVLSLIA